MSSAISFVLQVFSIAIVLHYAQLNDAASLGVAVVAISTIIVWRVLARQHNLALLISDDEQSSYPTAADVGHEPPHPIAVVLTALTKAAVTLGLMVPFFACARFTTPYRLPFEGGWFWHADKIVAHETNASSPKTALKVVDLTFVEPNTYFADAVSPKNYLSVANTPLLGKFELEVNGQPHPFTTVKEIMLEDPLAVVVIRDVSPSILASEPFPQLGGKATYAVTAALQGDSRDSLVRIADFADQLVTIRDWTNDYKNLGDLSLSPGSLKTASSSAVAKSIVQKITELSTKQNSQRILVVISDFANNVKSRYDANGLVAEAQSKGVTLILIYLKTRDCPPSRIKQLEMLAKETDGACIDGADPYLSDRVKMAVETSRHSFPAYRLMFDTATEIKVSSLQVRAAVVETPMAASVTSVKK